MMSRERELLEGVNRLIDTGGFKLMTPESRILWDQIKAEIAKSYPEPVGFIYEDNNEFTNGTMFSEDDPASRRIKGFFEPVNIRKVYADTPAREPLSEQEIGKAYFDSQDQVLRMQDHQRVVLFARAIERAHGIGKEET